MIERVAWKEGRKEGEDGVYRWRRQLSAPLTAGRERRCCRRTADRVDALSEHGEPARSADLAITRLLSIFSSPPFIQPSSHKESYGGRGRMFNYESGKSVNHARTL